MSRPTLKRLSVVPRTTEVARDPIGTETHRLLDIESAAQRLHLASVRLHATPRYPEIADYRNTLSERFEEAVKVMREALGNG